MLASHTTDYLFGLIEEAISPSGLSPQERIPKLRVVLEALANELTKEEPESFSTLFARCVFIADKYRTPPAVTDAMHRLRKLANKVLHEADFRASEADYRLAVKHVCLVVGHFSKTSIPERLSGVYDGAQVTPTEVQKPKMAVLPLVRAVVLSVSEARNAQGTAYNTLYCAIEEPAGLDKITVNLWPPLHQFGALIWKYATVHLTDLQVVPDKDGLYSTQNTSIAVLEPDYLINATHIANCIQENGGNPGVFLLDLFVQDNLSEPMLLGTVANLLLDELLLDRALAFDEAFERAMKDLAIELALTGFTTESQMVAFRQKAQSHFETIRHVLGTLQIQRASIEPTFFSAKYGLHGRLDLLIEQDRSRLNIVELKSGSPGNIRYGGDVRPYHAAQLAVYDLLLESTFGERSGSSSILYSAAERSTALRNVPRTPQMQAGIIDVRNRIVAYEHQIAYCGTAIMDRIASGAFGAVPRYSEADASSVTQTIRSASDLERAYFQAFMSFIAREKWVAKVGAGHDDPDRSNTGFASLWLDSPEDKRFDFLEHLTLNSSMSKLQEGLLILDYPERIGREGNASTFRENDIAVLYPLEPDGTAAPLKHPILKCSITRMDARSLSVTLRNKQINYGVLAEHRYWAIEHDLDDTGFAVQHKALIAFLEADQRKRNLLLGLEAPGMSEYRAEPSPELTAEQTKLLGQALSACDYFLLQGPPGTGKTSRMLREMVRNLYTNPDEQIVLLAFTNRAVDEICDALEDIQPSLPYSLVSSHSGGDHAAHNLRHQIAGKSPSQVREYIANQRVFVATVSTFARKRDLLMHKRFTTAIVDEASQLLEPHLIGILSSVGRFILIGDEKQLPAVVTQREKDTIVDDPVLAEAGFGNLRTSLFERLLNTCQRKGWEHAYGMLETQRRMHAEIAAFPATTFYGGLLRTEYDLERDELKRFSAKSKNELERMLAYRRFMFIPTPRELEPKVNGSDGQTKTK